MRRSHVVAFFPAYFLAFSIASCVTTTSFAVESTPPASAVSTPSAAPSQTGSTLNGLLSTVQTWFDDSKDDPKEGAKESSKEESADASPAALESDAGDVLTAGDLLSPEERRQALVWRAPDFANQAGALGWSEKTFDVPIGFETRVAFWRDIYSKYSSNQGVLHDKVFVDIVYEQIDFSSIMSDVSLSLRQKSKAREKLVKERKAAVVARLKSLSGHKTAEGLQGEDLRMWKLFDQDPDPDRFKDAAEKLRVRFQLGQRDRFLIGIYHSGRYLSEMEKIFRDEKLPIELTRLPFVESSFNIRARSRVGASGIWQFMRRTGRSYLKMNHDVDERNDPLKATNASAKLLKENFQMLRSWPLAVTAYNHGAYGVRSIVNKMKTGDLAQIVAAYTSRRFGFASENFYACFLAALEVERNAPKYFREARWGPPIEAVELRLNKPIPFKTLVEFFDGDADLAELSNPHLSARVRRGKSSVPKGSYVRVPNSRKTIAEEFLKGAFPPAKLTAMLKAAPALRMSPNAPAPAPLPVSSPMAGASPDLGVNPAREPVSGGSPAPQAEDK